MWVNHNHCQVSYGPNKRNSLDVYLISDKMKGRDLAPVVVYIGGGGWTVGFRVWALLMAKVVFWEICLLSIMYLTHMISSLTSSLYHFFLSLSLSPPLSLSQCQFFTDEGVLLLSVDYRNFPQGTVSDMLTDVNTVKRERGRGSGRDGWSFEEWVCL